jgi:hypothetical protein
LPIKAMNASRPVSDDVMFDALSMMLPNATQVVDAERAGSHSIPADLTLSSHAGLVS